MTGVLAEHITVQYGERTVLHDVSVRIKRGRILAILGPNGAGKSTLLKTVLGLVTCKAGHVKVGADDLDRMSYEEKARTLAYVPQRSALQARLTVVEVVNMGRYAHQGEDRLGKDDRAAVSRALRSVDMENDGHRFFSALSGGEQARVLIARALATQAPFLLLDEPTANLDVSHAMDCLNYLRSLADQGKGIAVVMHDLNQAEKWTDEVLLLHKGKTAYYGFTKEAIVNRNIAPVYGIELIPGGAFGFKKCESVLEDPRPGVVRA